MITVFIAVIAKVKLVIMRLFAYVMVKFIRIRKVLILMRYMTDEQLITMTKDEANKTLSYEDKVRYTSRRLVVLTNKFKYGLREEIQRVP